MPKQFTAKEVRQQMVEHIDRMVRYWAELPGLSVEDRCDGVAFSVLTMLDGAGALPPMLLTVCSSGPGDEYPDGLAINADIDLHDAYTAYRRDKGK